jgi:hypothetical protein
MGFCLFECRDPRGFYMAVNVAHVDDIVTKDKTSCRLGLDAGPDAERLVDVMGLEADIRKKLYEAAKIGFHKAEVTILAGRPGNFRAAPLLLNAPGRVVMVRELLPDGFVREDSNFVTVSLMTMADGSIRHIADRAGLFARKANARGKVPMLVGGD